MLALIIWGISFGTPSVKSFSCDKVNLCTVELSKAIDTEEELWFKRVEGSKIMYRSIKGSKTFQYQEVPGLKIESVTFRGKVYKNKGL